MTDKIEKGTNSVESKSKPSPKESVSQTHKKEIIEEPMEVAKSIPTPPLGSHPSKSFTYEDRQLPAYKNTDKIMKKAEKEIKKYNKAEAIREKEHLIEKAKEDKIKAEKKAKEDKIKAAKKAKEDKIKAEKKALEKLENKL